jgi:CHASE3 domain sensor protein
MAKRAKLSRIVAYTFNLLLVLVFIRGLAGYWAYRNFVAAHDLRGRVYTTVMSLRDLQDLLLGAASGARAYVITGNEEDYAPFIKARSELEGKLSGIRRSIRHNDTEEIEEFDGLVDLARRAMEYQENIIK